MCTHSRAQVRLLGFGIFRLLQQKLAWLTRQADLDGDGSASTGFSNPRSRARAQLCYCCARCACSHPARSRRPRAHAPSTLLASHPASCQSGRLAHRILKNRALCETAHGADRRRGGRIRRRLQWATVRRSRTGRAGACTDKAETMMTACRGPVEVLAFEPPRRLSLALGVGPEVAGLAALVRSLWRSVCGPWSCQSSRDGETERTEACARESSRVLGRPPPLSKSGAPSVSPLVSASFQKDALSAPRQNAHPRRAR